MSLKIDAAALSARTPDELSSYLGATGWRVDRRTAKVAYWVLPVGQEELEILQPLDSGLRDYASRVGDALVVLAAVEQRSELEVLRRISVATIREEAAVRLRERTPEEDVTVTGEVVRLHREGPVAGEITLVGRVDESDVLRRIWVHLPVAEYEAATRAHQEMRPVKVRGSLVRRGTRYYLAGPSGFTLLPETD